MPPEESTARDPIRVLLWSVRGCGTHYYGPGTAMYRMYSAAPPGMFSLSLAHAYPDQDRYDLFEKQFTVGTIGGARRPLIHRAIDTRRFLNDAKAFLAEHHASFDVFHGLTGYTTAVKPAMMAEEMGLPAVIRIANHHADIQDNAPVQRLLGLSRGRQRILQRISGVVAISRAIHDELLAAGIPEARITRIANGVDIHKFRPTKDGEEKRALRQQFGWRDIPTLLFVGRISQRKRPHLLIEALHHAKSRGHECQVVMLGPYDDDAAYLNEMKDRARAGGVESSIIWAGYTADPAPMIRAADAFCLPSAGEGMSAALVEAMSSGLAPIVTLVSGTDDLVEDGVTGCIVQPTAQSVGDAWLAYLDDPAMCAAHASAARQLIEREFSLEGAVQAYADLFRRIMKRSPDRA